MRLASTAHSGHSTGAAGLLATPLAWGPQLIPPSFPSLEAHALPWRCFSTTVSCLGLSWRCWSQPHAPSTEGRGSGLLGDVPRPALDAASCPVGASLTLSDLTDSSRPTRVLAGCSRSLDFHLWAHLSWARNSVSALVGPAQRKVRFCPFWAGPPSGLSRK